MVAAYGLAGLSLLGFVFFLLAGSSVFLPEARGLTAGLAWNAGLSVLFFLQHNVMARRSVKEKLGALAPGDSYRTLFALASGLALAPTFLAWSRVEPVLFHLTGPVAWLLRGIAGAALVGIAAAGSYLHDVIGPPRTNKPRMKGPAEPPPLVTEGPYAWVRHPQYALLIVVFWAMPTLTADRLFFNMLWSAWLILAARLEECNLLTTYGDDYRAYKRRVPMLIPIPKKTGGA